MSYKIGNDNGRVEGSFDTLTAEDVVGKFEYGKRDRSENDKVAELNRKMDTELYDVDINDNDEIIRTVTSEGKEAVNGND